MSFNDIMIILGICYGFYMMRIEAALSFYPDEIRALRE